VNGIVLALVATSFAPGQVYRIAPPDVIRVENSILGQGSECRTKRQKLPVRADGTIGVAPYGAIYVAGLTTDEAADHIRECLAANLLLPPDKVSVRVKVVAFRSQSATLITDAVGYGDTTYDRPLTGRETVLDLIASVPGLPEAASRCRIFVERPAADGQGPPTVLRVDWEDIVQKGNTATNYSLQHGDRLHVQLAGLSRKF
jgi:protein involved in polysaccharide export with SLBB domain